MYNAERQHWKMDATSRETFCGVARHFVKKNLESKAKHHYNETGPHPVLYFITEAKPLMAIRTRGATFSLVGSGEKKEQILSQKCIFRHLNPPIF